MRTMKTLAISIIYILLLSAAIAQPDSVMLKHRMAADKNLQKDLEQMRRELEEVKNELKKEKLEQQKTIKMEVKEDILSGDSGNMKTSVTPSGDTIRFRIPGYKILVLPYKADTFAKKDKEQHKTQHSGNKAWFGLEVGVNGYLTKNNSFTMENGYKFLDLNYPRSWSVSLNIFEKSIPVAKEYFKIGTGLGFQWNNYYFSNNTRLVPDSDFIYGYKDTLYDFTRTKLRTAWINIPVLLEFNTNKNHNKAFHIAVGAIFGYNLGAKTKLVYNYHDKKHKDKAGGDYDLNPFKYGATVRLGYGNFQVFANYDLSAMFKSNTMNPELHAFTIGLLIN
jgi:hypothetical protein